MFIKRFVGKDMQDAIKKIRAEFGPDAVIIDSKTIRSKGIKGLLQKKMIEVVAAYEPDKSKPFGNQKPSSEKVLTGSKPAKDKAQDQNLRQLGDQINALQDAVADFSNKIRIVGKETTLKFSTEALELYNKLIERDVNEELAKQIAEQAQNISGKKSLDVYTVAKQLIIDRIGELTPIKLKAFKRNVFMFAGPTGAGKTTTLAKLAGMFAISQKLNVGIINMDTYRIGAMEHIKIYADIMDVALLTAYNAKELKDAVKEFEDKDVVLIDTAGKTAEDEQYGKEMQELLDAAQVDELFLVISLVTSFKVCKDIIRKFSFNDSYRLIITKLDEIDAWGNVLNISDYAKKVPSYLTLGQNVPDDISETDPKMLADNICGQEV